MAPKWWQIESIDEKRARERSILDQVSQQADAALRVGDVTGARQAIARSSPRATTAADQWRKDLGARVKQRMQPGGLPDSVAATARGVVQFGADRGAGNANAERLSAPVRHVLPDTQGNLARSYLKSDPARARFGGVDKMSDEEAIAARTKQQAQPTGTGKVLHDLNVLSSGQAFQKELGINTSYFDKLREHGFLGSLAAGGIDAATAPATIATVGLAGAVGATGRVGTESVGRILAQRWAQETAGGAAGMAAGQVAAEQTAKHTDNPWIVGGAALGAGLIGGVAAYDPAATARGATRVGKAVGRDFAQTVEQGGGVRGVLANEAGQADVIPRGSRLVHGASDPLEGEPRPSEFGAMGKGFYNEPLPAGASEAELANWFALRKVGNPFTSPGGSTARNLEEGLIADPEKHWLARGANATVSTGKDDLLALRADKQVTKSELKRVLAALPEQYSIEPAAAKTIDAYAAARAKLLHQESVAWTMPLPVKDVTEADGVMVDVGRTLTKEESAALDAAFGGNVIQVGTADGAWFLNAPWSGADNQSFHNIVKAGVTDHVAPDAGAHIGYFRNGGNYIEGGTNGQGFERVIAEAGFSEAYQRASEVLQPRLQAVASDFAERYDWQSGAGAAAKPGFLSDAAGNAPVGLAANLGAGAAGAAYGYATGEDTQDRWKRALAFGVGGFVGGAALQAGAKAFNPEVRPTTAPPRPTSVLSTLPDTAIEARYTNASGIERIIPKTGTTDALSAVDAKLEALKRPGAALEAMPPLVRNGVALLNPSVNQDQRVLAAWRASQGVRATLQTTWTAKLEPIVQKVEALLPTAQYTGPKGTLADGLIGSAKDIAENPELYNISPELRSALDDLSVAMWDDVAAQARASYGVDVRPFEAGQKPGFTYLPTIAAKDSIDNKIESAFASLSTKAAAKRRGFQTARERVMNPNPRALAAGEKVFVPETDLRELVSAHIQSMASNAGHATLKEGAGGRALGDVLDELHPGLTEAKTRVRGFVTGLNQRMKTATAAKADVLDKMKLNDTQLRQLEKRMQPLENRIAALESTDEFGPELSYLSGQVRELRMMRGKITTYAKTLEGRKNFSEAKIKGLDTAIDNAQSALDDVVKRYESAGTGPYVRDPLTQRWYTPEAAKSMKQLLAVPTGFGKAIADTSDEIRAWHLAGDASLGTIQGSLGVLSDPMNAAKTARKMLGKNPVEELKRLAQAEPDDVAEYTFATGRQFGSPLPEMRQSAKGFERIPGIRDAQDHLSAAFERGSYEAWKHERDILLTQNPDLSRNLAGHEAANMLSKVIPGMNPSERGVSGTRAAVERGAMTSVSFATAPALLGAEAAKGTANLAKQGMLRLMRSASANPEGAWAALSPREQIAVRRSVTLAASLTAIGVSSAIISAPSRNLSVEEAVKDAFDPSSRYFMALQLGEGRSVPIGGPFRSFIKALYPTRDGVMFGNLPGFYGSRINSPIKPAIDIARNKDFFGKPIYEGNIARPENALRALWYGVGEGILPVSAGQVSEDVRTGQFDPTGTTTRVIAQFLGSNLSPVSPTEKLNQVSRNIYQKEFYDLLPAERDKIKTMQPKLWDEAVKAGSEARQKSEALKNELRTAQAADDQLFLDGKLTLDKWEGATSDRSNQLVGAENVLFADAKGNASKPVSPILDAYYQQIDASSKANNGRVDWDVIDQWKASLSASDQKLIETNTGLNKTPLVALKQKLQKDYYSLPRYRGYTSDQAYQIDDLWQEVRNASNGSDPAYMLAALRKNPALTQGVDPAIVLGVKRRITGLLNEDNSRANWAKAHPEAAVFLRRGKLTQQDTMAIQKAMKA